MKRIAVVAVCALSLQGCGLPMSVSVASWVADGISYLATEKTLTDHGLSAVLQQDCALMRPVLKGEDICRSGDDENSTVTVAATTVTDGDAAAVAAVSEAVDAALHNRAEPPTAEHVMHDVPVEGDGIFQLAQFETAAGGGSDVDAAAAATDTPLIEAVVSAKPTPSFWSLPAEGLQDAVVAATVSRPTLTRSGTIYYVVGSFDQLSRALTLRDQHQDLKPVIMMGALDGRAVYRVSVGPFAKGQGKAVKRRLAQAGIYDAWAVRMPGKRWTAHMDLNDHGVQIAEIQK